jgi:hypothetical protein
MTIEEFSKQLIEKSLLDLAEKSGTCNSSAAGTLCPRHGDADCNSSKQNRKEEFAAEAKNKEGKEQGADGKACWDGYKYAGTKNGKDKCVKSEEKDYLPGSQEKLDANKNGKLDAGDFKKLRAKKGKTVKEMWQVSEGKKVEIEIMPNVDTPNDPEPPTGKKAKKEVKKEGYDVETANQLWLEVGERLEQLGDMDDANFKVLGEKKLSAKEKTKKEKVVKGMKKKFGKMKSKYGDKAQSVMYGAATNMAKKSA